MRLAGRVTRLERRYGVDEHRYARSACVVVDSRYPDDQLHQFIAERGFDDPECFLVIRSLVTTKPAAPIIEPYVLREAALV
jgi:hypothetical protein